MRGSTFLLEPSDRRENLRFCFSLLSLFDFFFPLSLVGFPPFLLCWLLSFSPFSNTLLPLFAFHFISFSFSLFSHFLFSLIFSSLSFSSFSLFFYSFGLHQPNGSKSGKHPHYFLLCHLSFSHFSYFFHFPSFSSCDAWLNVSHLSQFSPLHGYHAMCLAPRVPCGIHMVLPCGIHMVLPCVTRHSIPRKT